MAEQGDRRGRGARPARAPRRITPDYLQRAAMHYLERYSAPAAQLRRVLARKIALSCRHHGEHPALHITALDDVVARCVSSGLVDDERFAEARAATLRRRGRSARAVAASLAAKGVGRELAERASTSGDEEEMAAARTTARRKRLGPWSRGDRAANRQKDLAALARAGFSIAVARAVIDGAGDDDADGGAA
ncbi:regulatory protein RecX [Bosea minatitlanensis]|uniref:Regulatory protein RecX n=1 Tax=Bosea minatitlanensis TaxID=128782 RepID=A0ABW0F8A1_9HYPH|nr:RecX family transcriptional regulator [Bosea minatitlanensis]MCT4493703.1 RecX family transcriptional regulator [Bosea minatitlanensis]